MLQDTIEISNDDVNLLILKETVDEMSKILDFISDNIFNQVQLEFVKGKPYQIQGQELGATRHTLFNILRCVKSACFSDAFTLVRKFRDDLMQFLFIIYTLNEIERLSDEEEDILLKDIFDKEKAMSALNLLFEILSSDSRKKAHEKAVGAWLENSLSEKEHYKDRMLYFGASQYISMLETDDIIKNCFETYLRPIWDKHKRELNNYAHSNGRKYVLSNLPNYIYKQRKEQIMCLVSVLRDIMVVFISLIILVNPSLIQSTDYIDYLELNKVPPEGSQYWIAPIIQSFIDSDIVRISPDLKLFLKENNRYGMQIE